jgi:diguanylate cyclase (GGDEF)-like protein
MINDDQISKLILELEALKKRLKILEKENAQLKELCITDELTGLYNWRCFNKKLMEEVARNRRQNHPMCLMFFDVDGLKKINDTHGHSGGNDVLIAISHAIKQSIRKEVDSAYRFGGDEFAVILPEVRSNKAVEIAKRIISKLSETNTNISLSFGIAELESEMDADILLKCADKAMYMAKKDANNNINVYK